MVVSGISINSKCVFLIKTAPGIILEKNPQVESSKREYFIAEKFNSKIGKKNKSNQISFMNSFIPSK